MSCSWPRLDVTTLATLTPDEILEVNARADHASSTPRCTQCGLMEVQLKRKLKRCGGCSMATYCSKGCQKEAWGTHKCVGRGYCFASPHYAHCLYCRDTCRPADNLEDLHDEDQPLAGYKSASALGNAIKHWLEYHDYGFRLVNCATVLLHNNIPTDFTNCSRAFKFSIDVGIKREGTRGNPAKAFQLNDVSLVEREELGPLSGDNGTWNAITALCHEEAELRRQSRSALVPAAVLPAVFLVMGTGIAVWKQFPVFLPPRKPGDMYAFDESARAVLADTRRICIEAMSTGAIFRPPKTYKPMPDIGTLARSGKKWVWEGRDDHPYWVALARRMSRSGSPYKSGLAPFDIWARFHSL